MLQKRYDDLMKELEDHENGVTQLDETKREHLTRQSQRYKDKMEEVAERMTNPGQLDDIRRARRERKQRIKEKRRATRSEKEDL